METKSENYLSAFEKALSAIKFGAQKIELANQNLGPEQMSQLTKALQIFGNKVGDLDLSGNNLRGLIGALAKLLENHHCIYDLKLNNCCLEDSDVVQLASTIGMKDENKAIALHRLYLRDNKIEKTGLDALIHALKINYSFQLLDLRSSVSNDNLIYFATNLPSLYLEALWLGGDEINGEAIQAITNGLKNHHYLDFLHLHGSELNYEAAIYIADLIKNNSILKGLYLDFKHVDVNGAAEILNALKNNLAIIDFSLSGLAQSNEIEDRINNELLSLFEKNFTLQNFKNLPYKVEFHRTIKDYLERNAKVEQVWQAHCIEVMKLIDSEENLVDQSKIFNDIQKLTQLKNDECQSIINKAYHIYSFVNNHPLLLILAQNKFSEPRGKGNKFHRLVNNKFGNLSSFTGYNLVKTLLKIDPEVAVAWGYVIEKNYFYGKAQFLLGCHYFNHFPSFELSESDYQEQRVKSLLAAMKAFLRAIRYEVPEARSYLFGVLSELSNLGSETKSIESVQVLATKFLSSKNLQLVVNEDSKSEKQKTSVAEVLTTLAEDDLPRITELITVLKEKLPQHQHSYALGLWFFAHAIAAVYTKSFDQAAKDQVSLQQILEKDYKTIDRTAYVLLNLAYLVLDGVISNARPSNSEAQETHLNKAREIREIWQSDSYVMMDNEGYCYDLACELLATVLKSAGHKEEASFFQEMTQHVPSGLSIFGIIHSIKYFKKDSPAHVFAADLTAMLADESSAVVELNIDNNHTADGNDDCDEDRNMNPSKIRKM